MTDLNSDYLAAIYLGGAILTLSGGLFAIRKGWWTTCGDGESPDWEAGALDAFHEAVFWPILLPFWAILGGIFLIEDLGERYLKR